MTERAIKISVDDVRSEGAKILENLASIEMEDSVCNRIGCVQCTQAASNAAQLRYAAAILRNPAALYAMPRCGPDR